MIKLQAPSSKSQGNLKPQNLLKFETRNSKLETNPNTPENDEAPAFVQLRGGKQSANDKQTTSQSFNI
jgi:hypothetical protein